MASHRDTDTHNPELIEAFRQLKDDRGVYQSLQSRGEEMLKRQLSTIAAGNEQDEVLFEKQTDTICIKQLSPDPDCLRISIGEVNSANREKYLTLRGDPRRARKVLIRMLRELESAMGEGLI